MCLKSYGQRVHNIAQEAENITIPKKKGKEGKVDLSEEAVQTAKERKKKVKSKGERKVYQLNADFKEQHRETKVLIQ